MRLCLPLVFLAVAAFAPRAAHGDAPRRAVVALDRGRGAKAQAELLADRAIRIVAALQRAGTDTLLLAAGSNADGKPVFAAPQPTIAGVAALGKEAAHSFTGPTDPRAVLGMIPGGDAGGKPIDVYLLGPFHAEGGPGKREDGLAAAVRTWNEKAPEGSRIFSLGLGDAARATLAEARGLEQRGWLVLRFEKPSVETEPYRALGTAAGGSARTPLRAQLQATPEVLRVGASGAPPSLVSASTDLDSDQVGSRAVESLTLVTIERALRDGRTATVSFRALEPEGVRWLCEPPGPLTFRWDRLEPGARLLGPNNEVNPVFEAIDAEARAPVTLALRIQRSLVGPAPAWRAVGEEPAAGLSWTVGPEVRVTEELGESDLRIEFRARPATPVDEKGVLVLEAGGLPEPLRVPYVLRVGPGRAKLVAGEARAVVPRAEKDAPVALRIEPENGNVPGTLRLGMKGRTDYRTWLTGHVAAADGSGRAWPFDGEVEVPVGVDLRLAIELKPGAPRSLIWPAVLTVVPAEQPGVELTGSAQIVIRKRAPRITVDAERPALRVEDGEVVADRPLVLRLDPDGGDADWVLGLMKQSPRVARSEGGVEAWEVAGAEPGIWHVLPRGAWSGNDAMVFDDDRAVARLWIEWDAGAAPGPVDLPVTIPARHGPKGWLFVGLAVLAAALACGAFVMMRPPPLAGTLLYTVARMEGTVGRLDLAPAGRRPTIVAADMHGRLELGIAGELVARLKPTRVGGMIEVRDADGGWERRLLVDGLSLRAGAHVLRYVSGRPGEAEAQAAMASVPDLLGPEYDLESGRIESLDA